MNSLDVLNSLITLSLNLLKEDLSSLFYFCRWSRRVSFSIIQSSAPQLDSSTPSPRPPASSSPLRLDSFYVSQTFASSLILSLPNSQACLNATINLDMACIRKYGCEIKRINFNFSMAKDKSKYLEEIVNSRPFKLLHGYVIANGNVFVNHCLLEPIPSLNFTSQEGHWAIIKRPSR